MGSINSAAPTHMRAPCVGVSFSLNLLLVSMVYPQKGHEYGPECGSQADCWMFWSRIKTPYVCPRNWKPRIFSDAANCYGIYSRIAGDPQGLTKSLHLKKGLRNELELWHEFTMNNWIIYAFHCRIIFLLWTLWRAWDRKRKSFGGHMRAKNDGLRIGGYETRLECKFFWSILRILMRRANSWDSSSSFVSK